MTKTMCDLFRVASRKGGEKKKNSNNNNKLTKLCARKAFHPSVCFLFRLFCSFAASQKETVAKYGSNHIENDQRRRTNVRCAHRPNRLKFGLIQKASGVCLCVRVFERMC